MNTNVLRTMLVCVALATLATGCVSVTTQQRRVKDCHDANDCRVEVSVIDCGQYTCHATVDVDEIHLHGNNVFWELSASDKEFRFAESGIFFKSIAGGAHFKCNAAEQGRKFHCNNNSGPSVGKEYKYGVQLLGPKSVWVLDPWVVN